MHLIAKTQQHAKPCQLLPAAAGFCLELARQVEGLRSRPDDTKNGKGTEFKATIRASAARITDIMPSTQDLFKESLSESFQFLVFGCLPGYLVGCFAK